jgi:hypothetical protein
VLPNSSIAISNEVIDPCTSFNLKSNVVIHPNTLHFKALKRRSAVAIMLDADAKLEEKSELIPTNYTQHYFMKEDNTRYAPPGTKEEKNKKKYLDESKSISFPL